MSKWWKLSETSKGASGGIATEGAAMAQARAEIEAQLDYLKSQKQARGEVACNQDKITAALEQMKKRWEEEQVARQAQQAADPLRKSQESNRRLQLQLQSLQHAIASIVLRLKVLDLEALEKDLGPDGTVPLRMALSELRQLVAAYEGMPKTVPGYGQAMGGLSSLTTEVSGAPSYAMWTSNTTSTYTGGGGNP
jgi:hypothetical protein